MSEWTALPEAALRAPFADEVGNWQRAFAAQPGQRWALHLQDAKQFAAALYGAWHAGKDVWLPPDAQPATQAALHAHVDGWAGDAPGALTATPSTDIPATQLRPLDAATTSLTVYTSGSSGAPTAIAKSLAQLDAEVHALETAFGARMGDAPLQVHATVSHQHIYGLLFAVLWPLAAGRQRVAQRIDYPEQMADRLWRSPCVLVASPAHLTRLPDTLDWAAARGQLRAVFSSGGPLPKAAAEHARALLGHTPIEVHGSTETGGIAWRQCAPGQTTAWRALPGVEWQIEDELLAVRSRHLPNANWFVTADRAVEADGGYTLLGRSDRIVKLEEKRISLAAIEQALRTCAEVSDARVLPVEMHDGRNSRMRLGAVVVLTASGAALLTSTSRRALTERLRSELAGHIDRVALPRRWRFVAQLPVDTQGKSTEALLRALFQPEQPTPRWLSADATHATLELRIDAGLRVFDGHFDATKLLPGVAQLHWAIGYAHQRFGMPPRFVRLDAVKFQRPITPDMTVQLDLHWQADKGQLAFRYASTLGPHSSGRVLFQDAPAPDGSTHAG